MAMDDTRKRYIIAGVVVGAVAVGLIVLSRKVPREKWGETVGKIARDGLKVVKALGGNTEAVKIAEVALDRALPAPDDAATSV